MKRLANNGLKPLAHETLTFVTGEGVVAEVGTPKQAENYVGCVDNTNDLIGISPTDKKRCISRLGHALHIATELQRSGRCDCPRPMQLEAYSCRRNKLALIAE